MADILQMTLPNVFSWTKIIAVWFIFHLNLVPMARLATGPDNALAPKTGAGHYLNKDGLVYWHIYALLGGGGGGGN